MRSSTTVEVGCLFGGLAVRATGVAEVIEHDVHRDRLRR
jgi:hypothetical protein